MDGTPGETLASYLTRYFLARSGYSTLVPPEAADLVAASDFVLTRMSWGSLHIMCLVDGQAHPGKHFALMPDRVREIAAACRKYCGSMNFSKMPITVEIIEIADETITQQDRDRLTPYRRSSIFSKAFVFAARIDARTKEIWRNRWKIGRSPIEKLLQKPFVPAEELRVELESPPSSLPQRPPMVTWGILAGLVAMFVLETLLSDGAEPSLATLISLGGLNAKLVAAGEWWRGVSATVLHANLGHIAANGISLYVGGRVLESLAGRTWFAAIYVVAGLCGSIASIANGAPFVVAVGGSGAIMGIIAAAAICGLARRRDEFGAAAAQLIVGALIPTLGLAVWGGQQAANVDHSAHFGGAVGGALAALAMLTLWPRNAASPRGRQIAAGVAGIGALLLAYAAVEVVQTRKDYAITLGPNRDLAGNLSEQFGRAPKLVQLYPDDPRAHFALGLARYRQRDFSGAERALRTALGMDKTLMLYFEPGLAVRIRSALVAVLLAEGDRAAAREQAVPLCKMEQNAPLLEAYWKQMMPAVCN